MELLGPPAAGLFLVGIAMCLYFSLLAGRVRIPDDPPEVDLELDELYRLRFGDSDDGIDDGIDVELRPVA